MKILKLLTLLAIPALMISSCDGDEPTTPDADYSSVINDVAKLVIQNTYDDLDAKAQILLTEITALNNNPSDDNLSKARQAWVNTRQPWESSEGFLFGPVDTEGIDPSIDSWPVNVTDLNNVLSSSDALTQSFVNSLEGTLKGFHTIEFLLWGENGDKVASDFNPRQYEYLVATTQVLAADATQLSNAWKSTSGNFIANLLNAGESGSIYISQKAVLEELAAGALGIADEVGNGKINDPLEQENVTLEESQFSNNSKTDFTNNIKSIQHVYNGVNGKGLSEVVAEKDADLDAQIKSEIQEAIDAIQAIPGTFTDAIDKNSSTRAAAENAQSKVRQVQTTFEEKLIPLVSSL